MKSTNKKTKENHWLWWLSVLQPPALLSAFFSPNFIIQTTAPPPFASHFFACCPLAHFVLLLLSFDLLFPILFCCSCSTFLSLFSLASFLFLIVFPLQSLPILYYPYFQPPYLPSFSFLLPFLFLFVPPLLLEICKFCSMFFFIIMYCFWINSFSLSFHVLLFPDSLNPRLSAKDYDWSNLL